MIKVSYKSISSVVEFYVKLYLFIGCEFGASLCESYCFSKAYFVISFDGHIELNRHDV